MAKICAALTSDTVGEMIEAASQSEADIVEVRLDFLGEGEDVAELKDIEKPIISTCMPAWEGGRYSKDEACRLDMLSQCLGFSKSVTIELDTPNNLLVGFIEKAKSMSVEVIVSHHDFNQTPKYSEIIATINAEMRAGADIAKVSYAAKDASDVTRLLLALMSMRNRIPLIALSMGDAGSISRILTARWGGYLTYGSVGPAQESAPGQLTVGQLRRWV